MVFKNQGILGINARNLLYIKPYNPKKAIKLADNKLKTKQFLAARGIPVPRLFGVIKDHDELEKFDFNSLSSSFVIKPNHGYGGEGIIPIIKKDGNFWITASGRKLSKEDLQEHINDILDGRFSLSNIADSAFFEQFIVSDDTLGKYSYEGLPDIRVVVHNLIPVMAMLRLPTKESEGKANLHMGAVGVGIDIAKGEATHITHKNKIIEELPDNKGTVRGIKIPYWDEILNIASNVQLITNLGYMAVDICIDKNTGPVLLEINARAGLGVQIANLAPLRKRLERIEGVKVNTPKKGVRIAKDMFGNVVEKEIANVSGKEVVYPREQVEIILKKGVISVNAKIDTGRERSILDEEVAQKAGLLNDSNYDEEKSTLKLKFTLKNNRIPTVVDLEKVPKDNYKMILGRRDLKNFLIDTNIKKDPESLPDKPSQKTIHPIASGRQKSLNYHKIDQALTALDNRTKLLYHLKPTNLIEEREKFLKLNSHNPVFEYPKLKFDPLELIDGLNKIETDQSPIGKIFERKKDEVAKKIALLEKIGDHDFTDASIKLYGKPSTEDRDKCKKIISELNISALQSEVARITPDEASKEFEKVFKSYGLKNWKVKIKESMVADCIAGKNNRLFINKSARFTKTRVKALIVHEIETHILTAENGKMQNYEIFNRGLADYLITQEGLAVYNVEKQLKQPFLENYKAMAHVVSICTAEKESFSDTYRTLIELGIPPQTAFKSTLKAKRGLTNTASAGTFTKDYIYYKGYHQIKNFVENGGKIEDLYIGKMNLRDLETVKEIKGISMPKTIPKWLK